MVTVVAPKKRPKPGRPRTGENALARWIDQQGWSRAKAAQKLGITETALNFLCRNARRPSLELAFKIQRVTKGTIPAESWLKVPPHGND